MGFPKIRRYYLDSCKYNVLTDDGVALLRENNMGRIYFCCEFSANMLRYTYNISIYL